MIHLVLPARYLARRRESRGEPQTRLMLAVLQTVVDDYRGSTHRHMAGTELARG